MLVTLELSGRKPQFFAPSFVEDAALILSSRVKRNGFLKPRIAIELTLDDGGHMRISADELIEIPCPAIGDCGSAFPHSQGSAIPLQESDLRGSRNDSGKSRRVRTSSRVALFCF